MALESVDYTGDLVATNPPGGDAKSEGDDHIRNIKKALVQTFKGMSGAQARVVHKTVGFTLALTDNTVVFSIDAPLTITLPAVSAVGNGFKVDLSIGSALTLTPNGVELVNGINAPFVVAAGATGWLTCDGTKWIVATAAPKSQVISEALLAVYPVGCLYLSTIATNPATVFGFGTWVAFGAGRALVALDAANPLMDTVGETFGSANAIVPAHTHAISDPGHAHTCWGPVGGGLYGQDTGYTHSFSLSTSSNGTGISINSAGVSVVNQNYQPSIAVYVWKRTV